MPPAARTRGQEVSQRLLNDIRSGAFAVGAKLPPERELMVRYAVGRNTLREAVQGLAALGLVSVRAGSGTTVLEPDGTPAIAHSVATTTFADRAVDDLLEFRLLLEPDAAAKAAERASTADHSALRQALADYQGAARERSERRADIYDLDVAFHRTVAVAAHNAVYLSVIDTTAQLLRGAMREADRSEGDISLAAEEHAMIAHHILLGDAAAAKSAMAEHIAAGHARRLSAVPKKQGRLSESN
ncbi:FadR/GntR family transcriptional regulator [Subtercola lobariae]|uniref:GntR family transcriptional regulator n=1 Tax=Subtercola lobariae TaxID=1588641 RepID=A0A917ETF5_9MICO|nr:FCD domain-containing protein [Subtercola lobariae]GGF13322.1 GntR family transcriptional regulator [Subtercola lobariae]